MVRRWIGSGRVCRADQRRGERENAAMGRPKQLRYSHYYNGHYMEFCYTRIFVYYRRAVALVQVPGKCLESKIGLSGEIALSFRS